MYTSSPALAPPSLSLDPEESARGEDLMEMLAHDLPHLLEAATAKHSWFIAAKDIHTPVCSTSSSEEIPEEVTASILECLAVEYVRCPDCLCDPAEIALRNWVRSVPDASAAGVAAHALETVRLLTRVAPASGGRSLRFGRALLQLREFAELTHPALLARRREAVGLLRTLLRNLTLTELGTLIGFCDAGVIYEKDVRAQVSGILQDAVCEVVTEEPAPRPKGCDLLTDVLVLVEASLETHVRLIPLLEVSPLEFVCEGSGRGLVLIPEEFLPAFLWKGSSTGVRGTLRRWAPPQCELAPFALTRAELPELCALVLEITRGENACDLAGAVESALAALRA